MSSLYLDHFGLSKPPFQITPDLDFFFSGGRRGDILSALLHVAAHDEGIITLVAEVGSGKTLLARLMISRLGPEVCAVYLANPCFSRDEIIAAIARDLGLSSLSESMEGKLAALQQELLRRHASGQRVLLVIDEAHAMPVESLEEVRLLSNLETGQHKLINIMLFGQPELDALLSDPRLRQVRDRVIHRFELPALLADEASAYIDHRLRAAGWHGARLFSAAALTRLVNASDGRARRINLLADKALLAAYAQGATSVEAQHVDSAVRELPLTLAPKAKALGSRWRLAGLSFAMASVISAGVIGLLGWWRMAPTAVATPASEPQVLAARPAVAPAAAPATVAAPAAAVKPAATRVAPARVTASDQRLDALLARTQTLLQQADLGGYTIQLAALDSSTSPDRDLGLATTQIDPTQLFARYSVYQGRTYLSLYSGRFESFRAAALAMNELPAVFKNNRPMVRSWAKIQQEQTP
ncbi:MAG: AAA family ATPase [Gammaproteobacteria bacterium]|nr:AAA family ATPase [Gammaproteobacteria bacterium]MBU3999183.1 AAA family ATPase [Gammaproteobacteria bacterium]MBU4081746.1 AAA family ATPase [Gammaproteobacteria bacterium]MBU4172871.1 AAA family ATPase [Gammaproteobacteria bacterium]